MSKNKYHYHPGSSFAGNTISGKLTKNNNEPWSNGTPSQTGALYVEYANTANFIQTGSSPASRPTVLGFSAIPSGTVTVGGEGSTAKPPTVAFMWICRYV